jgi:hypothetical protein
MTLSVVDLNSTELGLDATVDVLMGAAPTFTLSNSGAIQVAPGARSGNSTSISITPQSGFTGNIDLTCSISTSIVGAKDLPTCSFNSAVVNITGSGVATSTLTITTTAPTSAAIPSKNAFTWGAGLPVLAFVLLFGISPKRRISFRMLSSLVLVLWIGALGCGGGGGSGGGSGGGGGGVGGNSGTTPGAYSVKVVGTDAATGKITAQTIVALTVN